MRYYGIYPAIVIQNNDPEFAGRVKVYVPGVTNILYDGWNRDGVDKEISFIDGDLDPVLQELRDVLPWAQNVSPIFGGACDALSNGGVRREIARPSGSFSIPNVGAHTYAFFIGGDVNSPAFFGTNHGSVAWVETMGEHYPSLYENAGGGAYVNKHVISTNKHFIELVDSDGEESINIYSSKDAHTEIQEDSVVQIGGNSNITIGGSWDVLVLGNTTITTPLTTINGDVKINGKVDVSGEVTAVSDGSSVGLSTHTHSQPADSDETPDAQAETNSPTGGS